MRCFLPCLLFTGGASLKPTFSFPSPFIGEEGKVEVQILCQFNAVIREVASNTYVFRPVQGLGLSKF